MREGKLAVSERERLVLFFMGSRQMDKVVGNRSDRSVTPVRPVLTEPK